MSAILVTGMSGTGKSTVLGVLAARGYRVVDLDDDWWSVEVQSADDGGVEQLWREDRVADLLAGATGPEVLVVSGCASNQGHFADRFAAVILLDAPVEVMLDRIERRTTNPFGQTESQRRRVLADLATVEPLLRAAATARIDTRQDPAHVADLVEAEIARLTPGA